MERIHCHWFAPVEPVSAHEEKTVYVILGDTIPMVGRVICPYMLLKDGVYECTSTKKPKGEKGCYVMGRAEL